MSDLNAAKIFSDILPEKLEGNEKARSANAVYIFEIEGETGGTWTIDLTTDTDHVSAGEPTDPPQDQLCIVKMKEDDFVKMWEGKLPGAQAFMMGKLKIDGGPNKMGLAMNLQKFLG